MSIQSEITRISGNVSDAFDAITAKGVTVPSGSTSDDLATLIGQIQQSGGSGIVVTESPDINGGIVKEITAIDLTNDTVDAAHLLSGYTAHDRTGAAINGSYVAPTYTSQAKTNINPTTSSQTITADSGYDGLSSVQINPIPSSYQDVSGVTASAGDVVTGKTIVDSSGAAVNGSLVIQYYYTGSAAPSSSLGADGDIYLQTS